MQNPSKTGRTIAIVACVLLPVSAIIAGFLLSHDTPVSFSSTEFVTKMNPDAIVWMLICTVLVLLMQVGFLFLEAGSVRSKNAVNVAQKNAADFVLCSIIFFVFGYQIIFGGGDNPFFGFGGIDPMANDASVLVVLIYQFAFCATAATIVSGAIAERMSFAGYLFLTALIASVIYPGFAHLVWGNAVILDNPSYLADKGFIDFAGSTVVHSTAAWVALAAILVVGPRIGRFDAQGNAQPMHGSSAVMALAGTIILFVSWIGFNGGAVEPKAPVLPVVIANTVIAAAFGSASGMFIGFLTSGYIFKPGATINGLLGGLVAITAGCTVVDVEGAAIIGIVGGSVAMLGSHFLLHTCKIDDPVDVIAVHGFAGVSGTLMIALVAQPDVLVDGSRVAQLLVQAEGIAINFAWAFSITIIGMRAIGKFHGFRVSEADEKLGLNSAEHGVTLGIDQMRSAIMKGFSQQQQNDDDIHRFRLEVNEGEENADVALAFNTLLDKHGDTIENLDKMRTRAEEAARTKSEFLANMSHEIRTPMNGVMGMAELLANTSLDAKQRSFTDIIIKSGQSLLTILNDILDFSKIEAGKMQLDPEPFDLAEIIEDVGTIVSSSAAEKDVEVIIRIAPTVPKTLEADAGRIRQILHNLAGNAVKFTTQGHVFINVASYDKDLQRIRFEVQDTGVGIPEEKLALVFEKFSQVDNSATRKHDGTGLGLSICSALVSMMNGEIGVTSKEGKGSTFWFEIECPAIDNDRSCETLRGTLPGKRILVIDDNAVNRKILSEMLGEWDVDAASVSSGAEGLAMLDAAASRNYAIDCVILDYQMPNMTGSEVLKRIRSSAAHAALPVVVLSSVDMAESDETFRSIGASAHLTKPVRSAVIRSTLEKVLASRQRVRHDDTKSVQGIKVA